MQDHRGTGTKDLMAKRKIVIERTLAWSIPPCLAVQGEEGSDKGGLFGSSGNKIQAAI